jgi:DNA-binding NtrC family response regulator
MESKYKDFSILIVDDDQDLCALLDAGLKEYFVYTEHCLSSAGVFMANHKISLLFLDNSLPDGKGVDFIREVIRQDPNIKIVIMTADQSPELEEKAIMEGASIFIAKPFTLATVKSIAEDTFMNLSAA